MTPNSNSESVIIFRIVNDNLFNLLVFDDLCSSYRTIPVHVDSVLSKEFLNILSMPMRHLCHRPS